MTIGDESLDRAFELDALIETRRGGEAFTDADAPGWARPLLELAVNLDGIGRDTAVPDEDAVWARIGEGLAVERESEAAGAQQVAASLSVESGLDALAGTIELPDEDVVWARVSTGIAAGEVVARDPLAERLRRVGAFGGRRLVWGPLGAAAAVLMAVGLMLAQPPGNTAEAFVRDVQALSDLADTALADGVLTDDEKDSVAELAMELRLTIDRRPETLVELDAVSREQVLTTLNSVTGRLMPIADDELESLRGQARSGTTAEQSVPAERTQLIEPTAGPEVTSVAASGAFDVVTPTAEQGPGGREVGRRAEPTGVGGPDWAPVAPAVASSVTSLNEVADAVEAAGGRGSDGGGRRDDGRGSEGGQASAATPGYLSGLCRALRGQERAGCQQAVNAAMAACAGASARNAQDGCTAAVTFAGMVCEALLSERDAGLCVEALDGLTFSESSGRPEFWNGENHGRIDGSNSDNPGPDGRGDAPRTDREED